jgi:hypothetical protein
MGELELRIAALETAFIELGAWLDPDALVSAAETATNRRRGWARSG